MPKIDYETKKAEAIRWMNILGIDPDVIQKFKDQGIVSACSGITGKIIPLDDSELLEEIHRFEQEWDNLVYFFVRTPSTYFPWFTLSGADGEADAYNKLIAALGKAAREQKRISPTEKPQENLKYAMRLFLVRLGFVGNEYKQARKILLRELSGNCSWKNGYAPERTTPDEMGVETNEE